MFKQCVLPAIVVAMVSASFSVCEAGWHHRQSCGSCGSHPHRWHGSHGSSGGSSGGSTGGSAGTAAPKPAAPAAQPAGKASNRVPSTGAMLVLRVPERASVLINGQQTSLTGSTREFVANGLAEDGRYEYEVTVTVDEGGTRREVTKTVWLAAGTEQTLALGPAGTSASLQEVANGDIGVTTSLTITVPTDAEVWIEGQRTSLAGSVRRFSTADLPRGETWSDYEIRVVTKHDGQERSTIRKVTLTGGYDTALAIDPDPAAPGVETTAAAR